MPRTCTARALTLALTLTLTLTLRRCNLVLHVIWSCGPAITRTDKHARQALRSAVVFCCTCVYVEALIGAVVFSALENHQWLLCGAGQSQVVDPMRLKGCLDGQLWIKNICLLQDLPWQMVRYSLEVRGVSPRPSLHEDGFSNSQAIVQKKILATPLEFFLIFLNRPR